MTDISDINVSKSAFPSVFRDDIIHMAGGSHGTQNPSLPSTWQSILVLVSVRLGADELNMSYQSAIQVLKLVTSVWSRKLVIG